MDASGVDVTGFEVSGFEVSDFEVSDFEVSDFEVLEEHATATIVATTMVRYRKSLRILCLPWKGPRQGRLPHGVI